MIILTIYLLTALAFYAILHHYEVFNEVRDLVLVSLTWPFLVGAILTLLWKDIIVSLTRLGGSK